LLAAALKAKEQQQERGQGGTKGKSMGGRPIPWHLRNVNQPSTIYEEDEEEASLVPVTVFDPPKPPPPEKPLLQAALKAKQERDQGIYKRCPSSKSILKTNKFGGDGTTMNHDRSLNLQEIRIGSPRREPGAPRKVSSTVERVAVPMNAGLVRKNSMDRLQVSKALVNKERKPSKSTSSKIKLSSATGTTTKTTKHDKNSKNPSLSSGSHHTKGKQPPPKLQRGGSNSIMRLLGRRQKDTATTDSSSQHDSKR
jgi:hypothetical protein